jgi:hypothetical protein
MGVDDLIDYTICISKYGKERGPMQTALVFTLVLHVLSGVFWAGSTFTLARAGVGAENLVRPQLGAALIAVVTGVALWHLVHSGSPGKTEYILLAGAAAALVAAGVQGLSRGLVNGQRLAAALLGIAVICMAAARYA